MLEIDVVVDGFEAMLDVNVEAGTVGELLDVDVFREIEVLWSGDALDTVYMKTVEVVVLGVMFAMASIICDPPQEFSHFGDDTFAR